MPTGRDDQYHHKSNDPLKNQLKPTRRAALKTIVASTSIVYGAAILPVKWITPIINTVIIPAHAQTSQTTTPNPPLTTTNSPPTTTCAPAILEFDPQVSIPCEYIGYSKHLTIAIDDSYPCTPKVILDITSSPSLEILAKQEITNAMVTTRILVFDAPHIIAQFDYQTDQAGTCRQPDNPTVSYSDTWVGISGTVYTVSGSISYSDGVITMSELTFTPQ